VTITAANGNVADTTTGATTSNAASTAATTTISYVTATGGDQTADLADTDLSTQGNAQSAESVLNSAISYVAAQDGYIGAQINTLNSISQVVSTQQENVLSAQNAIQATDYASATSNLSKYEVLSQTGISALAQANSLQQEVTKLLQ
jgi:flagellin